MILMIYQKDVFREYVLPKTKNMDYNIIIDKNQFHIQENIELKLESVDNEWVIYDNDGYCLYEGSSTYERIIIEDGQIISVKTSNEEHLQIIVVDIDEFFQEFIKYDISSVDYITFGKSESSTIVYDFKDLISKNHGVLRKANNKFFLEDYSSNGIFVNYMRINGSYQLNFGDIINVFGLHMVFLGNVLAISSSYGNVEIDEEYLHIWEMDEEQYDNNKSVRTQGDAIKYFNRSPRIVPNIHTDAIEIEAPPSPKIAKKKPLLYTIGPSFTMAIPMMLGCFISIYGSRAAGRSTGIYMYTGIVTAIGSAVIGVIWALVNMKYARQVEKEDEQLRFDAYGNYLIEIAEKLKLMYEDNANALRSMYLSAKEYSEFGIQNVTLWNRNASHKDFSFCRLGLGDIPFQVAMNTQRERFTLAKDILKEKPAILTNEYKILKDVPVGVDFRNKQLYGIIGGQNRAGAMQVMYNIVAQVAANICYTDVKMVFVYNENSFQEKEKWQFAKWMPHVWSEDKKVRFFATNREEAKDVFYELANVIRHRSEEEYKENAPTPKPYYLVFISDASFLERELIRKYIFEPLPQYGMTTFIMAETYEQLPNECEDIIQYDQSFSGYFNTMDTTGEKQKIVFDDLDVKALTQMSKRLADIRVNETESNSEIPNSLDFFEMYGVHSLKEFQVLERWKKNRTFNTMAALIGKKSGGNDCYLDIHEKYHGPHGLIAGTTGSGKSETLQTYMLSLAINFSPDDIGFFIIDFKGGGMANLFSNLPHLIGQISNLSGNQVRRAMISIKSENMRRQRIFSEYGVNNINLYTRLYKNNETKIPIPHLFIIIDEFAELKREEPDFMRELISVAQVGRSLGVHLILATQKPNGTVDENIWSNSKFRLCLRVQDKQDSNGMLHKPDAAFITQAGRCYMQVGNDEIYELFQSGWSGAVYDDTDQNMSPNLAMMLTSTGKTAIVGSHAKIKRKEKEREKFYKHIINIVISCMMSEHITDITKADELEINKLIDNVIELMNKEGLEYDNSNSNVKRLKDMISIWPSDVMDIDSIVKHIIQVATLRKIKLPEIKEKTQLDAVVEYLKKIAEENGYTHNLQLWLPVLPKFLYFKKIAGETKQYYQKGKWNEERKDMSISVPIGLYDDPENQSQEPLVIDFTTGGHVAVCGTIVSGKSTFLQTLIYGLIQKYSPAEVNIYILDFSSKMLIPFEKMPHIGGTINENDIDGVGKLFNMLESIMDERKKVFQGGNYDQYIKAYGRKYPAIFVVVDNYANFSDKTDCAYADKMLRIAREGVGYGIYLILSSAGIGTSEIPGRIADNIRTNICLEMGDKFKYMDVMHVTNISVLPEADIKGRGLVNVNGSILEFQTALAFEAEDDYKRAQMITKLSEEMSDAWTGKKARQIPRIPEIPVVSQFMKLDEVDLLLKSGDVVPTAYYQKDASVYGICLPKTYCYCISGKTKTGKTNYLKVVMDAVSKINSELVIIEKNRRELEKQAEMYHAKYIRTDEEMFDYFKVLVPVFQERNKLKQKCIADGLDEREIYYAMQTYKPIFIFISNMDEYIKSVYRPDEGVGNMSGFIQNITQKGELHNIYFFAEINSDNIGSLMAYDVFKYFIGYKSGVHLGGNVAAQRIFTFSNVSFQEANKTLKKGMGMVASSEEDASGEKIVIPLYGK